MLKVSHTVFLYCCSDCSSSLAYLNNTGLATQVIWAATKKYSLGIAKLHANNIQQAQHCMLMTTSMHSWMALKFYTIKVNVNMFDFCY